MALNSIRICKEYKLSGYVYWDRRSLYFEQPPFRPASFGLQLIRQPVQLVGHVPQNVRRAGPASGATADGGAKVVRLDQCAKLNEKQESWRGAGGSRRTPPLFRIWSFQRCHSRNHSRNCPLRRDALSARSRAGCPRRQHTRTDQCSTCHRSTVASSSAKRLYGR